MVHCVLRQPDDFISLIGHGALETLQGVPQCLEGCLSTYCAAVGQPVYPWALGFMDTPLGMLWGLASWAVGRLWLLSGLPGILTLLCFHLIHSFLHQRARVGQGLCSGLNEMTVPCRLRHLKFVVPFEES